MPPRRAAQSDLRNGLTVVVGDSSVGVADMVCLSETSKSGTVFSIADIWAGPSLGRYYGKVACPAATEANFSRLELVTVAGPAHATARGPGRP